MTNDERRMTDDESSQAKARVSAQDKRQPETLRHIRRLL
jgi:hypothetical protein